MSGKILRSQQRIDLVHLAEKDETRKLIECYEIGMEGLVDRITREQIKKCTQSWKSKKKI